jgi:4-hydroxybenzoate polyprenyltransferase
MHTVKSVQNYFSLVKISHTIFSMPFAIIGYSLGIKATGSVVALPLLVKIILAVLFARNAAMSFNRYTDYKFDALNPRTSGREIPQKIISPASALAFVIANCILFILTTFFINKLCLFLSPVALAVILAYSYTKRFTSLAHLVLGLSLSLAPIGAYLAVTGTFSLLPVLFSVSVFFWVSGFDIIYALQDEEFDKSQNLKSIPAYFGKKWSLVISSFFHLISVAFLVIAGISGDFGLLYWIGILFYSALMVYQHLLVKPNDLSRVNMAFATMNGIAGLVFAVFVVADIFFK